MVAGARIKGQESSVTVIIDGVSQETITSIRSHEFAFQLELLREGYLGETTDRKDSIFRGIRGRFEMHLESAGVFNFVQQAINKARRRTPGVRINIKTTLNFPNGQRVRVMIPNAEFGEIPFNTGSRSDYITVTVEYEAQEAQVISA